MLKLQVTDNPLPVTVQTLQRRTAPRLWGCRVTSDEMHTTLPPTHASDFHIIHRIFHSCTEYGA
jgi:hypothetical protein